MKWVDYKNFKKNVNLIINEDDNTNMAEERRIVIRNKIIDVEDENIKKKISILIIIKFPSIHN